MTRAELIARRDELQVQLDEMSKDIRDDKKVSMKNFKKLCYEYDDTLAELEVLEGKTYTEEEWITKKYYESDKSLADARLGLAEMLSKLNGVKVEVKSGVQSVQVITKRKIYYYVIHAHHTYEEVEWEEREIKSVFSKEVIRTEKVCTKWEHKYTAWLSKAQDGNMPNWKWRY